MTHPDFLSQLDAKIKEMVRIKADTEKEGYFVSPFIIGWLADLTQLRTLWLKERKSQEEEHLNDALKFTKEMEHQAYLAGKIDGKFEGRNQARLEEHDKQEC